MPLFSDCNLYIEVDGKRLKEYCTKTNGTTVTTWIESESGKEFIFGFQAFNSKSSLELEVSVDGAHVASYVYSEEEMGTDVVWDGVQVDANTYKPLRFKDIELTEHESASFPHEDIGSIRVKLTRVNLSQSKSTKYFAPELFSGPVHENSKKFGAHRVCLGEPQRIRAGLSSQVYESRPFDLLDVEPIAIFEFLYRPRGILQALRIIPCDKPSQTGKEPVPQVVPSKPLVSNAETPPDRTDTDRVPKTKQRVKGTYLKKELSPTKDDEELRQLLLNIQPRTPLQEEQAEIERELAELEEIRRLKKKQAQIKRKVEQFRGRTRSVKRVKCEHDIGEGPPVKFGDDVIDLTSD